MTYHNLIFDQSNKATNGRFFSAQFLIFLILSSLVIFILEQMWDDDFRFIIYLFVSIISFYLLLFLIINYYKKSVFYLEIRSNDLFLKFHQGGRFQERNWKPVDVFVELKMLRNHRDHLTGFVITITNGREKLECFNSVWTPHELEQIYLKIKSYKKEPASKDELIALRQLQFQTESVKRKMQG
jgi:hypothetical protein